MKVSRTFKPNEPLQSQELRSLKPKRSHVLTNVGSSGVCHSKIHLWEGENNGAEGQFLKTTSRGIEYTLILDHHKNVETMDTLGDDTDSILDVACYSFFAEINQML
jgi:propanol-preferring alcohol dehydrogenase